MNDTMPAAATNNDLETIIASIRSGADAIAAKCPEVSDAALALVTALHYADKTLVDSSLASLWTALADVANNCILRELEASANLQAGLRGGWQEHIDKKAYEIAVFENVKDTIESLIDERVASMQKARKLVRGLEEVEQEVEKSRLLDEGIRQLRKFREEFLKRFPSPKPPYPIDREAVAKAREAFRGGHKGLSKDQMVWRDKRSDKAV